MAKISPAQYLQKMTKELKSELYAIEEDINQMGGRLEVTRENFHKLAAYQNKIFETLNKYRPELKGDIVYMLKERDQKLMHADQVFNKYQEAESKLKQIRNYMEKIKSLSPVERAKQGVPKYEKLERQEYELMRGVAQEAKELKKANKELANSMINLTKEFMHYEKNIKKGPTTLDHSLVIIFTAVFAGATLYALSAIEPENITTGAFSAGASSPIIFSTIVAAVIFFFFLATHHKLEQK